MARSLLGALLASFVITGCAAPSASPATTPEGAPPTPSPTSSSRPSSPSLEPEGADTIVGLLGGDDIEGGCYFVQTADGTRYEVIWPSGWRIDARGNLVDPSDEIVAGADDELTVRGQVASDMASICQIGPIFRASGVTTGTD